MSSCQPESANILVVDDTPSNLRMTAGLLDSHGYRVMIAEGGEEGLTRAEHVLPDLILLDVMMPDIDGFEVCRRLKVRPATKAIPVIFMTALSDAEHKLEGFRAGAVDYVTKPLQVDEVVARVSTHIKLRAMQRKLEAQNAQLEKHGEELEHLVAERTAELAESEYRLRESYGLLRELASQRETAREEERRRIAREVHDELGQYLTALRMDAALLRYQFGSLSPALSDHVQHIVALADKTIQVVRDVTTELRPAALDSGLGAALEWLAADFQRHTEIPCRLRLPDENPALGEDRATALFRIVQESLTNVARHAKAENVAISLSRSNESWIVEVNDDGCGFDPTTRPSKSFGLVGMRERALMLGGEIFVVSQPGSGTTITARIPLDGLRETPRPA